MCSIEQAVAKGIFLVGCAQAATEVKDSVVIVQGQGFEETLQFFETLADFGRIGFVRFGISVLWKPPWNIIWNSR